MKKKNKDRFSFLSVETLVWSSLCRSHFFPFVLSPLPSLAATFSSPSIPNAAFALFLPRGVFAYQLCGKKQVRCPNYTTGHTVCSENLHPTLQCSLWGPWGFLLLNTPNKPKYLINWPHSLSFNSWFFINRIYKRPVHPPLSHHFITLRASSSFWNTGSILARGKTNSAVVSGCLESC